MKTITANEFRVKTGYQPVQDDLQRVNCKHAGEVGHNSCGWCAKHDKPRFYCGCQYRIVEKAVNVEQMS